jgi:acyl-CoA reductase-like NAD-dependent aldehyde dehydrogenase
MGYFVCSTVFAGVDHDMRILQEDIFVAAFVKFTDDADAFRIANGTRYSLAAGVWSSDPERPLPRATTYFSVYIDGSSVNSLSPK